MSELHALLIGIDRYAPERFADGLPIPALQGCVHDVERVEAFLRAPPLSVTPERIRKLVSPHALSGAIATVPEDLPTRDNLVREIRALGERASSGDQILVHYSGHGARVPTEVPSAKGIGAMDEALVPFDAGAPGGGLLRDVELNKMLQGLASVGLRVTLILDCCHAGGVTRDLRRGRVRGLGNLPMQPGASPLGPWLELAALLPGPLGEQGPSTLRHLEGASGWFPQPEGCVLLAACLPTEYARECAGEDGRWSGALTHFFLEAAGDLGPRPTYRWLHHRLLGRIRGRFERQTPVLEGDGDLAFLGRDRWPGRRGIAILEVAGGPDGGRVLLGAGRAQGLGAGGRLEVRARTEEGELVAELEVVGCGATSSWARTRPAPSSSKAVAPGDVAAVVDPGRDTRQYRIGTFSCAATDPQHESVLDRLREVVGSGERPLLAPAQAAEKADFLVEVLPRGVFRILDPSGEPLLHQGEAIPMAGADTVDRLLDRLDHLARFRAVQDLENPDPSSPLFGRVRAQLFALDRAEDWQDPGARIPVGACPVPVGTALCLLVNDESGRDVNFAVLDLQPDWGISRAHPNRGEGDFTTLPAGTEHPVFLTSCLPDWMDEGRDVLKLIAATSPLDTAHLELDPLGESTGYRSFRGSDPGGDLRTRLLRPPRSGLSLRTVKPVAPVSHDWAVETVELTVTR
jgi:hypothetical protein